MQVRLALIVLAGCEGGDLCIEESGPGLTGTMAYTTVDGTVTAPLVGRAEMTGDQSVAIHGWFDDVFGRSRQFRVELGALAPSEAPIDAGGRGSVCLERQRGDAPLCTPLAGTVHVRRLARDCYQHQSGVGACAETIELSLRAASDHEGTRFAIEAEELAMGAWTSEGCDE